MPEIAQKGHVYKLFHKVFNIILNKGCTPSKVLCNMRALRW